MVTKIIIITLQGAPGLFHGSVKFFHPSSILRLLNILSSFLPHGLKIAASILHILPSHHVITVSRIDVHAPICDYVMNLGAKGTLQM